MAMLSLRRTIAAGASAALILGIAAACESPAGLRTGKVSLLLTDAPGDVLKAVVTIDRIYLQPSNDTSERVILLEDDVTTDLITLADSTASLIDDEEIPAGSYSQLRFVVSGAYLEVEGDAPGTSTIFASSPNYAGLPAGAVVGGQLQMPSLAQTGIKVNLPTDAVVVNEDETVTFLVDFDVAQSFGKAAGASGRWVMTPVLQGTLPVVP